MEFYKSLFEGVHRLRLTFLVNLADHFTRILLCALAWKMTGRLVAVVLAYSLAAGVACWAGARLRSTHLPDQPLAPTVDAAPLIRYSVPVFFMSVAAYISTEIDILMIGTLLDDRATAIFALPKQLVAYLPHISVAFTMGSVPELARMAACGEPGVRVHFRRILGRLALLYGALLVFGGALAYGLPRELLPVDYRESVGPFAALLPYVFFTALGNFTGAFLSYRGQAANRLRFLLLVISVNLILNALWIPRHGVVGAAWASSVAMAPYFLLNWFLCEKMLRPPPTPS